MLPESQHFQNQEENILNLLKLTINHLNNAFLYNE